MSFTSIEVAPQISPLFQDSSLQSPDFKKDEFAKSIQADYAKTCPENGALTPVPAELSPHIVYKIQYRHDVTREVVFASEDTKPVVFQSLLGSSGAPILEHITDVYTTAKAAEINQKDANSPPKVLSAEKSYLKINSPAIINALQSVVNYYPEQDFSGDSICLDEPFAVLVHHEKELAAFRDLHAPDRLQTENERCEREKHTYEHLGVLQEFMQGRLGALVENERLRNKRGFASFEMLWLLLKPGVTVYGDTSLDGIPDAYVVQSQSGGVIHGRQYPLRVNLWYLDYDGITIGTRSRSISQQPFNGEKEITALEVFPCEFWKASKAEGVVEDLRHHLEERGKAFFKMTSRRCMSYNGLTTTFPKHHHKGFVMVDFETWYKVISPKSRPALDQAQYGVSNGISQCLCPVCLKYNISAGKRKTSKFYEYDGIYPEKTTGLTSHQYLLCSRSVIAYVMEARSWDAQFDTKMVDTIVMQDDRRRMIKALAESHTRKNDAGQTSDHRPWTADFVDAKGEGKIFLLHGKPGVGKTYTAECISHYIKRPLLSLTISDIGTNPAEAERNLTEHFARAKLWDAIILIDEADIYMENRERQDLARNSLVSGFLRALEHCQSMLFLTTNRIGSFDDAFISRIHVTLYYHDFTEEQRQMLWTNFFDKLIRDRGGLMRVPIDTKDYTKGKDVRALKWNGREIRNAMQTAIALADYERAIDEDGRILLKDTHVAQIVRMSSDFRDYLDVLHRGDESKRAATQRIRYDKFEYQNGIIGNEKERN
ncbi:MAG: hypothetical protein Q9167_001069 [Letrouitia subvulpina]